MLDATVPTSARALLFTASGRAIVEDTATAIDIERVAENSRQGFGKATASDREPSVLGAFREQIKSGTVRGHAGDPRCCAGGPRAAASGGEPGATDLAGCGAVAGGVAGAPSSA